MSADTRAARVGEQAGYSLVEMLISTTIMLVVTGAIFSLVNPAQGTNRAQPEASDMQQRMRVASDMLFKDLVMVGAGPYQGPVTGNLANYFSPILPRRSGKVDPDPPTTFRSDAITLTYVPNTSSQTSLSASMPQSSVELKVKGQPNCPGKQQLCGFKKGMAVLIFDGGGNFDTFTVTEVQDAAGHLQHRGQNLNSQYDADAAVTEVENHTYYLDRETNQLRYYDGLDTDLPLVDNVVDLRFDYFGLTSFPDQRDPTLGPNCLYDVNGSLKPGMATLAGGDGSLVELPGSLFVDGPWCGSGGNQYDADLLRIRKIRVSIRVQAASPELRGSDPLLFRQPGTSTGGRMSLADYESSFEVSPRNMNLGR